MAWLAARQPSLGTLLFDEMSIKFIIQAVRPHTYCSVACHIAINQSHACVHSDFTAEPNGYVQISLSS
jgi:hypothetical protein